jgi:hypothetical protein
LKDEGPAWRYLAIGALCLALIAYMLLAGELSIDKQKTMTITRAANPFAYWAIMAASGGAGFLALRSAWRRLAAS